MGYRRSSFSFVFWPNSISSKNFNEKFFERNKADVFKTHSSIYKLKKNISYFPKTSLEVGMKKFIEWFKKFA